MHNGNGLRIMILQLSLNGDLICHKFLFLQNNKIIFVQRDFSDTHVALY